MHHLGYWEPRQCCRLRLQFKMLVGFFGGVVRRQVAAAEPLADSSEFKIIRSHPRTAYAETAPGLQARVGRSPQPGVLSGHQRLSHVLAVAWSARRSALHWLLRRWSGATATTRFCYMR